MKTNAKRANAFTLVFGPKPSGSEDEGGVKAKEKNKERSDEQKYQPLYLIYRFGVKDVRENERLSKDCSGMYSLLMETGNSKAAKPITREWHEVRPWTPKPTL